MGGIGIFCLRMRRMRRTIHDLRKMSHNIVLKRRSHNDGGDGDDVYETKKRMRRKKTPVPKRRIHSACDVYNASCIFLTFSFRNGDTFSYDDTYVSAFSCRMAYEQDA
ncbi:hypothetical protein [Hazenella coriacea]|uniref:hypothetical protein n=1 Tax=Hazenella coriacea TaxID=1179467 RepID=UPI001404C3FF|nr:hypothetical protein [Hazenella coriacea]